MRKAQEKPLNEALIQYMKKEKGKRRPNDGDNVNTEITTTNKQVCLGLAFTDGAELTLDTNLWQTVHHDD